MVAAVSLPPEVSRTEQRFALTGVEWKTYVLLREAIDDARFKMTYCKGVLEIMTPSERHEYTKKLLARLIELYAFLARVPVVPYGSTTYRNALEERGLEPDECYLMGREMKLGATPDFAIEVIETKPLLDKLRVYDGLAIAEVWLVENGTISIHKRKAKGGYARVRRSAFLPNLDPKLLERFMSRADHDAAIHEFADRVKGVGKKKKRR